jgi:hypothetical protein
MRTVGGVAGGCGRPVMVCVVLLLGPWSCGVEEPISPVSALEATPDPTGAKPANAGPFLINSMGTGWGVHGIFVGTYQILADSIALSFSDSEVRVSERCRYQGRRMITDVGAILVRWSEDHTAWDWSSATVPFASPNITLRPGESYRFQPHDVVIPREPAADLSRLSLWVEIVEFDLDYVGEGEEKGYCYADGDDHMFVQASK